MFELRHLQVFREVARLGSLSAAAESLAYTQPAVSQQMAALERRARMPLLERTTRGVRLTDAGEALLRHAEAILAEQRLAERELEAIAGLRGGRVRMASFPAATCAWCPRRWSSRGRMVAGRLHLAAGAPPVQAVDGVAREPGTGAGHRSRAQEPGTGCWKRVGHAHPPAEAGGFLAPAL